MSDHSHGKILSRLERSKHMSDLSYGRIRIGGWLSKKNVPEFIKALNADYPSNNIKVAFDLECYLSKDRLEFSFQDLNAGIFMCLESVCQKYGLSYIRESESSYSAEAEVVYWTPGMIEPTTRCANNEGEVLLSHKQVTKWVSDLSSYIKKVKNVQSAPLTLNDTEDFHNAWAKDILDHNEVDPLRLLSICLEDYYPSEEPKLPPFEVGS